ncbi:MAG: hypothetical protein COA45_06885 [Zetaproteobacteria bacterium]|nr:MAG: hypothetical protein COA45_06885 [Zetaproteobacteria bacterium]
MWDSFSRDLKRAAKRLEEEKLKQATRPKITPPEDVPALEDRLYVRVKEACKIMGMGHTALYNKIKEGRLPVKKSGKKTLIAVKDIHAWFDALPYKAP